MKINMIDSGDLISKLELRKLELLEESKKTKDSIKFNFINGEITILEDIIDNYNNNEYITMEVLYGKEKTN